MPGRLPAGLAGTIGTGFLVAPDLCLTNYHVVRPLIDQAADPARARLRFDYKRAADGTVVSEGMLFTLAREWLVAAAGAAPSTACPTPAKQHRRVDELHFALLRIEGRPGEEAVGRAAGLADAPRRGWIYRVGTGGFAAGDPLFLLQHPEGEPLKLAFGPSDGPNANGTRLRHQVNTEPGSSGSPCLNARLELVALHHAGDPNFDPAHKPAYNSAIPVAAIRAWLAGGGIEERLPGQRVIRVRQIGSQSCEIAGTLRGRGHERLHGLRLLIIDQALIDTEDEQGILPDGAAGIAAELILVDHRDRRREEVARIESVVAQKLPRGAVDLIGAGLRRHQHLRAGIVPVLGGEVVREDADFVDRRPAVDS